MTPKAQMAYLILVTLFASAWTTLCFEARLTVKEPAGISRSGGLVASGVPFARGAVRDLSKLSVTVDSRRTPAQFTRISTWDEGSVRWALGIFPLNIPAHGEVPISIRDDGRNIVPQNAVKVEDGRTEVKVITGSLRLTVSKKTCNLFRTLEVDGRPVLTSKGRGIVLITEHGDAVTAGVPSEVVVEEAGPLRVVILAKGLFPGVHNGLLGYTVRLTVTAGGRGLHARVWLENHGAHGYKAQPEWFHFDGLAIEVGLGLGLPLEVRCEGVASSGSLKVYQRCPGATWSNFAYTIASGTTELHKGQRTEGIIQVKGGTGGLTAALRHFWQNYEKCIEVDGELLRLWLWPTEAQWPRPEKLGGGGEKWLSDAAFTRSGLNAIPGGFHKSHEFVLDFSGRPEAEVAAELNAPLVVFSSQYAASTEAAIGLFAPEGMTVPHEEFAWKVRFWANMARNLVNPDPEHKGGLTYLRTVGNEKGSVWFGWVDFGDVCSPWGGWYGGAITPRNLHYDWTRMVLLHYLRTGERAFLDLGTEMARHQIEIDQNWSDRDDPRYRALMRPDSTASEVHTGGSSALPLPEENWLSGVVLYYQLTGDHKARECALRNYEGLQERVIRRLVMRPDDNVYLHFSLLTLENLLALYELTGEKKYLDDIAAVLEGHLLRRFRDAGPFLYEPRLEIRQQDYHMLGKQFCYGLAALCEYHYRTGDERVGKILAEACAAEFPQTFYEAPLYLADLYGYVGYMTGNESLLERAMDCFADTFPESRNPPVYHSGENNWTERTAMVLKAGNILQFVLWRGKNQRLPPPSFGPTLGGLSLAHSYTQPDPALVQPTKLDDGSLLFDPKGFRLKDCDVHELAGALGGKAVRLRQFTSTAQRNISVKAGKYKLIVWAFAPDADHDAFNVIVDGELFRLTPTDTRVISPCRPIVFTLAVEKEIDLCLRASEENGMSVDRIIIKPLP